MKNTMIHLENLIGKTFTVNDPNVEYVCTGFAQNETFIVFGAYNDTPANRFTVKSFKLTDAKFKGQVTPT